MQQPKIGVAIITHNAKHHLQSCLQPLLESPLRPAVLVVNSSSNDGTVEEAQRLGVQTLVIPRKQFNHGETRELARQTLQTPIVVMMTPDAYATSPSMLEALVKPLLKGQASVAYARQIPHAGAHLFEAFPRDFNYPPKGDIRCLADVQRLGVYAYFCSNSCCAYLNTALDEVGGFPRVLMGEDTVVAALLLKAGHGIAYAADAVVQHSHAYSLRQEFRRHFDIGYSRRQHASTLDFGVTDSQRGWQYTRQFLVRVAQKKPLHLPLAGLQLIAKWTGYQFGRAAVNAPYRIARRFSSQDFYWDSTCTTS